MRCGLETAMAGTPNNKASEAAPTVPLCRISEPILGPLLIPETTKSKLTSLWSIKAILVQSAGVPEVDKALLAPYKLP